MRRCPLLAVPLVVLALSVAGCSDTPSTLDDEPDGCEIGFADCDGEQANACETSLDDDADHCGACDNACATGELCVVGTCVLDTAFVAGPVNPGAIVVDATHVYWGTNGVVDDLGNPQPGGIYRVTIAGGELEELADVSGARLVVDGDYLYWVAGSPSEIWRMRKDGSAEAELVDTGDEILFNATRSYVRRGETLYSETREGTDAVTIDNPGASPVHVAVDDDFVYWMDYAGTYRVPADGSGSSEEVAGGLGMGPWGVQVFDGQLFEAWDNGEGLTISRIPVAGGSMLNLYIAAQYACSYVAGHDGLYVATGGRVEGLTIARAPLDPGEATVLYEAPLAPGYEPILSALALGADHVYWATDDGRIHRLAR